jgi:hypothetical protein
MQEDSHVARYKLSLALFVVAGTLVPNVVAAPSATSQVVGSYSVVYQVKLPALTGKDQVFITTFNRSTGAISGTSGAGDGVFWPFVMHGRVKGTSVIMDADNSSGYGNGTAVLTGTVNRDGTMAGTFKQSDGTRGTWTMTPLPTIVGVAQSGFSEQFLGHQSSNVTWGVVLDNHSRTLDAYQVDVQVQFVTTSGKVVSWANAVSSTAPIGLIPAGQKFYFGASALDLPGRVPIKSLLVTVTVGATKPRRYVLPPVSGVNVDRSTGEVAGTMTNPYDQSISVYDYSPSYVVYDSKGRIIGGGDLAQIAEVNGSQMIKPGEHAAISAGLDATVPRAAASSVRVSVTPMPKG